MNGKNAISLRIFALGRGSFPMDVHPSLTVENGTTEPPLAAKESGKADSSARHLAS